MAIRRHRRIDQPIEDLATHPHLFITVRVLAEYLEVNERTIIGMIHAHQIPAAKVGREWRLPTDGVRQTFATLAQKQSA